MSRLALFLFFIVIFHNGILKVANADETTTEGLSKTNVEVEVTTKPAVVEKVKDEVALKVVPEEKSGAPSKTEPKVEEVIDTVIQTIAATPTEEKDGKVNEPNKEGGTEDRFFQHHVFSTGPIKHTQFYYEIPKNAILGPVNALGGKIGHVVAQTINTAKNLASAPFGLLKSAVNGAFDHK